MLIAISDGYKIGQVDMTFITNNIDSIFLDCVVTSHIFLEQHLFSLYYSFTNDEYIIIGKHHHVFVVGIGSIIFMMVLLNNILKPIFIDALHIPTLEADLISLSILHY